MSSPAFGGKMTSTSGKTRQSENNSKSRVTSTLEASLPSGRFTNSNAIAAVDTVVSDGSVSPFEGVDVTRDGDNVGGGRFDFVSDSVNELPSRQEGQEVAAIPLIEIKHTNNGDGTNYNNNDDAVKIQSHGNKTKTSRNNNKKENNKQLSNTAKVKFVPDPKTHRKNKIDPGDNSDEERISMLEVENGGGGGCGGGSVEGCRCGGSGGCGQCGEDEEGNIMKNCKNCDDADDDDAIENHKQTTPRKLCCFSCKTNVKNKNKTNSDEWRKGVKVKTKPLMVETNVDCLETNLNVDPEKPDLNVDLEKLDLNTNKTTPDPVETKVDTLKKSKDTSKTKVDTEKAKVESGKMKVESGKTKVDHVKAKVDTGIDKIETKNETSKVDNKKWSKKDARPKSSTRRVDSPSGHSYTKVLGAIVFVPSVQLIPHQRRYEHYFKIKPQDEVELGKKPRWIAPRLKYHFNKMGCGTSNQVISMEGRLPIVVFGATGVIGGSVVRALLKDPRFMVKAITRTPTTDQARSLAEIGAVVVPADLNDVRSLQRVMEGAAGVFLTTNFWEHLSKQKELTHGMNAIDAAVSCNIHHFIFQGSEHTRDEDKPCGHLNAKAAIEEYVKETPLAFTSIHLPFLYENLLSLFKPHVVDNNVFTLPIPLGDEAMDCMALHDFARCVVNIFLRPKNHMLKSVQLTGDRMTVPHMVDVLNRHFDDRKFVYHKMSPDDFATFDFQGSQDLAAMFEFMQTAPHRDPRITRRIHHSVVCFDKWVCENKHKLVDAMKDTGDEKS